MGKLLFLIAAFIMVILFSGVASAASTIYVNGTSGNDTYDGTSPLWVSGTIGPKKTIQNASNAVDSSGTVNVASGTYNEHITLTKSLSLIGANPTNTIINGTNNGRAIYIAGPINVLIKNFTICNGMVTDYGGGINNYEGTVTINNSVLTGNHITNANGFGGAIYNEYGALNIINSTFSGNSALGLNCYGGALCNAAGSINIVNSTLSGNTAEGKGGAIYNYGEGSTVTISNSTLFGNTGAVYNCGGGVIITNSTLFGNTGAIANTGYVDFSSYVGTLTISNSTLSGNIDGAIINSGTVTITDSNLSGNNAFIGGAIYNYFDTFLAEGYENEYCNIVTIINSTLTGNTATHPTDDSYGGAIYNDGILTITGSTLSGNNATMGGAIYNYFDLSLYEEYPDYYWNELTMHYNRVANNSPNSIYNNNDDVNAVNVEYNWWGSNSNPSSQFSGSGILDYSPWLYMNLTASPTFIFRGSTSTLTANFNNAYDGTTVTAINPASGHLPDGSPVTFTTTLGNVGSKTTTKNTTNGVATAILTANEGIGAANITAKLDNQTLYTIVGIEALYVNGATGNDSWNGLSPTFIGGTTGPIKTIQTAINTITMGATVIVANGTYNEHLTIDKSLSLIGTDPVTTIIDGTNNGRVLYMISGINVNITNFTLQHGNISGGGGAINFIQSNLTIINCNITENTANGGAIYNGGGMLTIISSNLTGNNADDGGAIFLDHDILTTIINSTFTANHANVSGGAIYHHQSVLNVINSTFTANSAKNGGAINVVSGTLTINGSTLYGNTATNGGTIYNTGTTTLHFNRIIGTGTIIASPTGTVNAQYNWWGSNSNPYTRFTGAVNYSPWLYMTLTASPTLILDGSTSTLTASFNNAYNGATVTPINPADGHLPDGGLVTFTTNLGNVGSKTTTKSIINGIATAILTADEGKGKANITAQFDSQILDTIVEITYLYVNDATGDDDWDGLSPIYLGGKRGPMKTINNAIKAVNVGGTIIVASGTYIENLVLEMDAKLIGNDTNTTIISTPDPNINVIVIEKGVKAIISGFTIQDATNAIGVLINGVGVEVKNNNIFNNNNGIVIGDYAEKCIVSSNNIKYNNIGIYAVSDRFTANFNSIFENNDDIFTEVHGIDATYNWWGQNEAPNISGVITSPWLYMTLTPVPSEILDGQTSQIIASFNNAYDGDIVTPIDPAEGHIQNNSPVTFTTDLGNVGSKTTIKNTINGTAIATLSADETPGIAYITALFDKQELYADVKIIPARYVNGLTGDDTYDGSSPVWISGLIGPMKTIQTAVNAVESSGVVSVASGTYNENIVVEKLVQIINDGSGIVTVRASNALLSVFLINPAGSGTIIQALNITGGSTGIYLNGVNNCNLTGNNLTGNSWSGIGISGAQGTVVENNNVSGNQEGIYILNGATNNRITGNTISGNQFSGVCVDTSYNTNISNNGLISGNSNGIRLYHATGNVVSGNNLPANLWCAIVLDGSSYNHITGSNTLTNNVEGIHLMNNANNNTINGTTIAGNSSSWCGMSVWGSTGNNLTNNYVSGNQEGIYLTQSASYNTVSQNNINNNLNSAICLDQNSQHNNIQNNTNITLNGNGIRLYQATMNTITLNTITQSVWAAICLDNASSNNVSWNTASGNQEGIYIFNNANSNTIFYNTATNNAYSGICVNSATDNNLIGNTISLNGNGIRLYNYADNNNITSSTISQQGWAGIVIDSSHQNQIHYNNIQSNGEGLYSMNGSNNNYIYYNNFISNTNHNAYEDGTTNIYDDGSTGNYWSDYSGIGMYFIQIGNVDRHPV